MTEKEFDLSERWVKDECSKWRVFCEEQHAKAVRHAWIMYFMGVLTPFAWYAGWHVAEWIK